MSVGPPDPVPYEREWAENSRLKAVIALSHPRAVLIFSLIAWLTAALALREIPPLETSALLLLAMGCAQAGIGLLNEVFDRDIDALAKPWRAIPRGVVSARFVAGLACGLFALGGGAAYLLSPLSTVLLAVGIGAGVLYSAGLKRTPFSWLPYLIAYPLAPLWALASVGRFDMRVAGIFTLVAPFALATHLCNQLRDFETDASLGVRSFVHTLGKPAATQFCYILLGISPLPGIVLSLTWGQFPAAFLLILVAVAHWIITLSSYLKGRPGFPPDVYRRLFRKLQLTGFLLIIAWLVVQAIA